MVKEKEKKIKDIVGTSDYQKGRSYYSGYINYVGKNFNLLNGVQYNFNVESETSYRIYNCCIETTNNEITKIKCTCPQYNNYHHCKHIAAVLCNYIDDILSNKNNQNNDEYFINVSENILNQFYTPKQVGKVKKQLKLEVELILRNSYFYGSYIEVKLKIGEDKLYSLNNKINLFTNAYIKKDSQAIFGKNFTYDPNIHYFSSDDEDIINYFTKNASHNYRDEYTLNQAHFDISDKQIGEFLKLLENKKFLIYNYGTFNGIIKENPYVTNLSKDKDGNYIFNIDIDESTIILDNEFKYVIFKNKMYKLDNKTSKILSAIISNHTNYLIFKKDSLEKFTRGILPSFKNNIILDSTVDDVVISNDPTPKLYFDLLSGKIICNLKFDYDNNIVEYFDSNSNVLRNYDFEEDVLTDILKYGLINNGKKIILEDDEAIGRFIEYDLKELALKYDTFTSQKLKETNIVKNTKVTSQFSIGQDNIMSYNFDIDGIDTSELSKIFDSMKQKKKYYKLKNGDFIDIDENNELKQLQNLIEDMEISNADVKNGYGTIPKYRAIYLDSLRTEKYNIIETNNLFNELLEKFNSYKDAPIDLSKKDLKILRDYQVIGVKWLTNIHRCGLGGILADEMGLGKSIQVIYFIKQILKENQNAKILIVSPTSLVYNWKNEFDKFGSELKYKVFAENKDKRIDELKNIDDTNILITTYGLLRQDSDIYYDMKFDVCVIDEAQNIKNINTQVTKVVKKVNATTKIALSGTPIENSVLELWSIFDFIMPGYLSSLAKFKSKYNIKDVTEDEMKVFDDLNKQISAFILRRKKSDVILELPDKIENNIYLDLYPEQKKLYVMQVKKTQKEMDEIIRQEGFIKARFKILQLLTRLRQICIDPKIIFENYNGGSCKIDNLVSLVKDIIKNNHKILIFTSYRTALDIVQTEFNNNNISSYVIAGDVSSKKRMELVDKFNNDDTNVFLIMLKAGGTGLNLTSADVVIHLDLWWNPQVENQATDRAHRIGQKNTVEVIKLICKGTIEERIVELQNKKKILSDSLIDGKNRDKDILSTLSEKDLKELISYDNEDSE